MGERGGKRRERNSPVTKKTHRVPAEEKLSSQVRATGRACLPVLENVVVVVVVVVIVVVVVVVAPPSLRLGLALRKQDFSRKLHYARPANTIRKRRDATRLLRENAYLTRPRNLSPCKIEQKTTSFLGFLPASLFVLIRR